LNATVINPRDNVAVALVDVAAGSLLGVSVGEEIRKVKVVNDIPRGHKIALVNLKVGEPIVKYGEIIGIASSAIKRGEHVHTHNVVGQRGKGV